MMEYNARQTHCGQYRPYGDFYREWEIKTEDENKDSVLSWCFENLYNPSVPEKYEWTEKIRSGGEKYGDYGYYFAGWHELKKIENGWEFTICEPYCD